ncbi:MAG: SOS response-associated peptidase [Pseudomonadota bacterium]
MCSRYSLTSPPEAVRQLFALKSVEAFPPRYNIAPTQPVLIVRDGLSGDREATLVRWGLIPSWAKDPSQLSTMINARAETAASKPSFRGPVRHKRCIVPADGFYEWTGPVGSKQPHLITIRDDVAHRPSVSTSSISAGGLMGFAGLWEHWLGADGSEMESMAILTVPANHEMRSVHDRMPLILAPEHFDVWLDCSSGSATSILPLLETPPDGLVSIRAVSKRLNNYRNDDPSVQAPVDATLF